MQEQPQTHAGALGLEPRNIPHRGRHQDRRAPPQQRPQDVRRRGQLQLQSEPDDEVQVRERPGPVEPGPDIRQPRRRE